MTTDFENDLRRHLQGAAEDAPRFTGLRADPPRVTAGPDRSRRRLAPVLVGVAAAVVLAGVVVVSVVGRDSGRDSEPGSEAACAAVVDYDGLRYVAAGEVLRSPRPGPVLGEGTVPGCRDGNGAVASRTVEARAVPGVPAGVAVITDDGVFVAEGVTSWPRPLDDLRRPLACDGAVTSVTGTWISMDGPMPSSDGRLDPPYVAVVVADEGAGLPLDRYLSVTLSVRVTDRTTGATDAALVRRGLQGGEAVTFVVGCDGEAYVADRMALGSR